MITVTLKYTSIYLWFSHSQEKYDKKIHTSLLLCRLVHCMCCLKRKPLVDYDHRKVLKNFYLKMGLVLPHWYKGG